MPLLLLDLDDTLLDRAGSFRVWGREFLQQLGVPASELDWLLKIDNDGATPRREAAEAIRMRYNLDAEVLEIVEAMHDGLVVNSRLDPLVACAIEIAGNAGWVPVVVSNGAIRPQEAKIRITGLDRYIADWVIAEEVGCSKPDPRIFHAAAERARMPFRGAWLVGDSPEKDIGGAAALGLPSVWLHRGRRWTEQRYTPTITADSPIAALAAVLHNG